MVLADRRFKLGGGRAFAVYVAGYTLGRTWIEMLRIDPANHIFGLRINVFTSVIVFLGAVLFLILRRHVGREDPALVWGPDRPGKTRQRADRAAGLPPSDGRHRTNRDATIGRAGRTPNTTCADRGIRAARNWPVTRTFTRW